jgi:hypothetical protein
MEKDRSTSASISLYKHVSLVTLTVVLGLVATYVLQSAVQVVCSRLG